MKKIVGGVCTKTVSHEVKQETEEEFNKNKVGMIYMTSGAYGSFKKFILKICEEFKDKCELKEVEGTLNKIKPEGKTNRRHSRCMRRFNSTRMCKRYLK